MREAVRFPDGATEHVVRGSWIDAEGVAHEYAFTLIAEDRQYINLTLNATTTPEAPRMSPMFDGGSIGPNRYR